MSYIFAHLPGIILLELAPLPHRPVAGFHRASPSATLDEKYSIFHYYMTVNKVMSIEQSDILQNNVIPSL